ncbi:hypothetical protein [Vibrio mediterranei]|uniref:hypothetical protein n=1 Tax=Vibrio mediterranei TaxID=689 RepID=UPI00148D1569|nr:hypothetical protein [Vibrio mediterranei]NOI26482.1 hypothetical protein [Vibrio mediterranei]
MALFEDSSLTKAQQRKIYDADYRAKRKARKRELVVLYNTIANAAESKKPGSRFDIRFKAKRINRKGECKNLPYEYAYVLKACEEFITNPKRFGTLYRCGGQAIKNIQCRKLIAKTLAVLLPHTDLIGGRIGEATHDHFDTISYDYLQEEVALRFGEYISPRSFAKAIKYLENAGYLVAERVNVCIDATEGSFRSAASFKQFTEAFFSDLKVLRYPNINELIRATRERKIKEGFSFEWISSQRIRNRVCEIFNATKLNELANRVGQVFMAPLPFSARPAPS